MVEEERGPRVTEVALPGASTCEVGGHRAGPGADPSSWEQQPLPRWRPRPRPLPRVGKGRAVLPHDGRASCGFPTPQTAQQLNFHPLQHPMPQASSGLSFTVILCFTHVPPTPARLGLPRAGTVSVLCEYRGAAGVLGPVDDASAPWTPGPPVTPQDISLLSPAPSGCPCWTSS